MYCPIWPWVFSIVFPRPVGGLQRSPVGGPWWSWFIPRIPNLSLKMILWQTDIWYIYIVYIYSIYIYIYTYTYTVYKLAPVYLYSCREHMCVCVQLRCGFQRPAASKRPPLFRKSFRNVLLSHRVCDQLFVMLPEAGNFPRCFKLVLALTWMNPFIGECLYSFTPSFTRNHNIIMDHNGRPKMAMGYTFIRVIILASCIFL